MYNLAFTILIQRSLSEDVFFISRTMLIFEHTGICTISYSLSSKWWESLFNKLEFTIHIDAYVKGYFVLEKTHLSIFIFLPSHLLFGVDLNTLHIRMLSLMISSQWFFRGSQKWKKNHKLTDHGQLNRKPSFMLTSLLIFRWHFRWVIFSKVIINIIAFFFIITVVIAIKRNTSW